jgi:hypothetical protein
MYVDLHVNHLDEKKKFDSVRDRARARDPEIICPWRYAKGTMTAFLSSAY